MSFRVGFICTGNICRSPLGEVVLRELVNDDQVLRHQVEVSSAGTANWHVGAAMDPRARSALDRAGFCGEGSPAQFASPAYLRRLDLAVVMTREHRDDVRHRRGDDGRIVLLRSLIDPTSELDLADPYYGDDAEFDQCLDSVIRACRELVRGRHLGDGSFEA